MSKEPLLGPAAEAFYLGGEHEGGGAAGRAGGSEIKPEAQVAGTQLETPNTATTPSGPPSTPRSHFFPKTCSVSSLKQLTPTSS